jgi:pimeloyl-ACP methyl ester carboxylesterase
MINSPGGRDMATKLVRAVSWSGAQLKRGVVLCRSVESLVGQLYLLYLPTARKRRDKALVLVHGQSRNLETLVDIFRPYAERYGATLIAPVFDGESSSNYQRLGLNQRRDGGLLPHDRLHLILDDVKQLTEISTQRFHLFGHSGGAQFAHRYAMAFPDTVIRYAISSPGWFTSPDTIEAFPYGMKENPKLPNISLDIDKFLHIPVYVMVGENDIVRGAMLNQSERIDRTQGRTRVERAERWVAAINTAARGRGLKPPAHFKILPDAGHDLAEMDESGRLGRHAARFLFR